MHSWRNGQQKSLNSHPYSKQTPRKEDIKVCPNLSEEEPWATIDIESPSKLEDQWTLISRRQRVCKNYPNAGSILEKGKGWCYPTIGDLIKSNGCPPIFGRLKEWGWWNIMGIRWLKLPTKNAFVLPIGTSDTMHASWISHISTISPSTSTQQQYPPTSKPMFNISPRNHSMKESSTINKP